MEHTGFVHYGELWEYRNYFKEKGNRIVFPKGTDIVPYLRGRRQAFFVEQGILYFRIFKMDGEYLQVMAFKKGSVFPVFDIRSNFFDADIEMLVAARKEVAGYLLPIEQYYKLKAQDSRFSGLLDRQLSKITAYLSVSQIMYRDGKCITRICNFLYHAFLNKDYRPEILPMGQEELACTVNVSKSQVKRALSQLRKEKGIEIEYEKIVIKDIRIIEKYISESICKNKYKINI